MSYQKGPDYVVSFRGKSGEMEEIRTDDVEATKKQGIARGLKVASVELSKRASQTKDYTTKGATGSNLELGDSFMVKGWRYGQLSQFKEASGIVTKVHGDGTFDAQVLPKGATSPILVTNISTDPADMEYVMSWKAVDSDVFGYTIDGVEHTISKLAGGGSLTK